MINDMNRVNGLNLTKAKIIPLDENGRENTGNEIEVLFNPEQYSISKGNQFASIAIPGRDNPIIQFIKGEAETLSAELFFDTHTMGNDADARTQYVNKISNLLKIDGEIHAPPICIFKWGSLHFKGIIEKIDKNFTMFDKDGIPLRGTIGISFKQYHQPSETGDPSSSPDRTKRRITVEGDSLWLISAREYGNPDQWKLIASENKIEDPLSIKPGTEIIIPPLE